MIRSEWKGLHKYDLIFFWGKLINIDLVLWSEPTTRYALLTCLAFSEYWRKNWINVPKVWNILKIIWK